MTSSDEDELPGIENLDISNDVYYRPSTSLTQLKPKNLPDDSAIPKYGSRTIQHSLAAYDLWKPLFPTYLSDEKFRNFHRPKLRHYNSGPQSRCRGRFVPVKSLSRTIYRFQKRLRFLVMKAINEGMSREDITRKFLLIRDAKHISAKTGEIYLFEYSEEFPIVLNQVGMASNIKTYSYMPQNLKNTNARHTSKDSIRDIDNSQSNNLNGIEENVTQKNFRNLYFNSFKERSRVRFLENSMFRAPIYEHEVPSCDFLVIRTRNNIYIRQVRTIFTVGQTMPLIAVPQPNESSIQKFRCQFSGSYIHKIFMTSANDPPTLNLDALHKLFPDYARKSLRKRLTTNGAILDKSSIFTRGTSKFGLLSLSEHWRSFTPERYCLNMSMLWARERLRDLNYSESMINPPSDAVIETELLAAPWNTSKAVLGYLTSRHYLDIKGHLIDPSGYQREGFSCIPWDKSPTEAHLMEIKKSTNSKKVRGEQTDPLPVVDNATINKMKREKLERLAIYQKEAQLVADSQSNVLASKEILSSDEEEEENQDDENHIGNKSFEDQLRDLDRLIVGGRTVRELDHEKEEVIRRDMLEEMKKQNDCAIQKSTQNSRASSTSSYANRYLKIYRTYQTPLGPIERTEIVREPSVIALYVKMKGEKVSQPTIDARDGNSNTLDGNITSVRFNPSPMELDSPNESINRRSQSFSLGPNELCRTEGLVLTIAKSVLEKSRPMRAKRQMVIYD